MRNKVGTRGQQQRTNITIEWFIRNKNNNNQIVQLNEAKKSMNATRTNFVKKKSWVNEHFCARIYDKICVCACVSETQSIRTDIVLSIHDCLVCDTFNWIWINRSNIKRIHATSSVTNKSITKKRNREKRTRKKKQQQQITLHAIQIRELYRL